MALTRRRLITQAWPAREQVLRAYPRLEQFAKAKRDADPERLLWSGFADAYLAT